MSTKLELLTPTNCQVIFIDQQPQMAFGVQSIDRQVLKNNVGRRWPRPPRSSTSRPRSRRSRPTASPATPIPSCWRSSPSYKMLERTSMNSWDDQNVRDALASQRPQEGRRRRPVDRGLQHYLRALRAWPRATTRSTWSPMPPAAPPSEAHKYAMERMVQAGVVPVTWQQVLLEWQRDWARTRDLRCRHRHREGAFGRLRHGRRLRLHHGPQGRRAR